MCDLKLPGSPRKAFLLLPLSQSESKFLGNCTSTCIVQGPIQVYSGASMRLTTENRGLASQERFLRSAAGTKGGRQARERPLACGGFTDKMAAPAPGGPLGPGPGGAAAARRPRARARPTPPLPRAPAPAPAAAPPQRPPTAPSRPAPRTRPAPARRGSALPPSPGRARGPSPRPAPGAAREDGAARPGQCTRRGAARLGGARRSGAQRRGPLGPGPAVGARRAVRGRGRDRDGGCRGGGPGSSAPRGAGEPSGRRGAAAAPRWPERGQGSAGCGGSPWQRGERCPAGARGSCGRRWGEREPARSVGAPNRGRGLGWAVVGRERRAGPGRSRGDAAGLAAGAGAVMSARPRCRDRRGWTAVPGGWPAVGGGLPRCPSHRIGVGSLGTLAGVAATSGPCELAAPASPVAASS